MMPEHAKLFESPVQRLRAGANVQLVGSGGVFTFTARPVPAVEEVVESTAPQHPFQVTRQSGNNFRVQSGQIDGETIVSEVIDVGSSRPVAIRIYPQYTVGVYNSEFVYSAVIKGSPNAPVLESDSNLSDVTAMSSAGTEARAVIATIDSANEISQIATGNLVSTIADDQTLNGEAIISWNKAA